MPDSGIHSLEDLKDKAGVFRDREHAGQLLAGMLERRRGSGALVLAIPAGGVPVAAAIAGQLELELDVIPVSKILFPWTTEAGFGAVAFDGTEWINRSIVEAHGLDNDTIVSATFDATEKVRRRLQRFRGDRPAPSMTDRTVILVDDGVAAGSTMRTALASLQKNNARKIIIAVPTAHDSSLHNLAGEAAAVYCANIRSGLRFAVAEAYQHWTDVSEDEVISILESHGNSR